MLCGLIAGELNLCRSCLRDLPWIRAACRLCARPLLAADDGVRCGQCDIELRYLDRVRAALVYEFPVDQLLAQAKFRHRRDLARAAGDGLAEVARHWQPPDLLIPVPLHPRRLVERGFNQAEEIAASLTRCCGVRADHRAARRNRHTQAQSELPAAVRRRNLRGAFSTRRNFVGLQVAIVDDVVTTGSTASELARSLREAGAESVELWSVARVVNAYGTRNT